MKLSKTVAIFLMGRLTASGMAAPDLATVHSSGIIELKTGGNEAFAREKIA